MKRITAVIIAAALAGPAAANASTGGSLTFSGNLQRIEQALNIAERRLAADVHHASQAQINADGARVETLAHRMREVLIQQAANG